LFLAALIYAPIWDIAPPDVSDLAVVRTEVPPEENAYACFLQATNELHEPPDFSLSEYLRGQTNDDALVSAVIATNQAVIAWIKHGVERPFCQEPDNANNFSLFWRFFEVGQLLATQARFERMQGRMSEATDAALLLMQYGARLHQASDNMIDYPIANGVVNMGLTQAMALVRDKRCGPAERARLLAALTELRSANQELAKSARGDYAVQMELLEPTRSGRAYQIYADRLGVSKFKRTVVRLRVQFVYLPSYFMQYNRTRHLMAGDYRLLMAHAGTAYADHPLGGSDTTGVLSGNTSQNDGPSAKRGQTHRLRWPSANVLGLRIWRYQRKMLADKVRRACGDECKLSAVRLLLACRAYEETTGHLPETLEALVPDYLSAVPRDPFDGQPFRYSTERRIIYSVGEDLTDDGGTRGYEQGRRQRQKDLVFDLFTHEPEPPNS
ncbi:MAG TPA: hypothetical protein P5527_03720, partial [Kiritimatiellia bacterium]|nr:hypothetical protein [Kiritimatiellia bacterium]